MSEQSWLSRNGIWAIPLGCIVLVLVIFATPFFCCFGTIGGVFKAFRSSEVVQQAFETAKSDPRVIEALGEPIEMGFMISGNLSMSGASGDAEMSLPLSGPKGEATLYLEAQKRAGKWEYQLLTVVVETDGDEQRIDLLLPAEDEKEPPQAISDFAMVTSPTPPPAPDLLVFPIAAGVI